MTEVVARPYARALVAWVRTRPDVICLAGDLTTSCEVDDVARAHPDQYLNTGMAEQNMMGVAAGLAREGLVPFVHTFSVFATRRPYDQVAMSIAYPNLPVRIMGFLPGLTTPGGVTHQAIDDVALMRGLPNMTVVECGDATEVETLLPAIAGVPGPVFCRMLRGEVPRLFDEPLTLGQARVLASGNDVCLVSSGICTEEAMAARDVLTESGISTAHVHVSTIKPFVDPVVTEIGAACRHGVITVENHSVTGGLGSAVAEQMAEAGTGRPLVRLGLRDTFAHGGSRTYLLDYYGLTARHIVEAAHYLAGAGDRPVEAVAAGNYGGSREEGL